MSFLKNVLWALTGSIGVRIVGLITTVILARLLAPDIFGIVGMALVIIGFIYVIQEAGLSSFLVQAKDINKSMISTSFVLNIILSIFLVFIVFLLAPYISKFYNQPQLEHLFYYSCAGIIIASFGITQRGLLIREKQFKKLSIVDLSAELTTSVFSIVLALFGYPLLAVVLSMLFRPAVQSIALFAIVGLRPVVGKPDFKLVKIMFPFSSRVLGTRIVNFARNNVDYLLIGKLLGSGSLGLYTVAFQWSTVARFYFSQSIANVAFPEVARNQDNHKRVGEIYINLIKKIAFVTFPICIGLAMIAPEFVDFVYGDKWEGVIPVLQILMFAGLISSIGTVVGSILKGIGRPDIELNVNVFSLISFSLLVLIGSNFGITGVAYAVLINSLTFNFIMTGKMLPLIHLDWMNYFKALIKPALATMSMGILVIISKPVLLQNVISSFGKLILLILLGTVFYFFTSYAFNREMIQWVIKKSQGILKIKC
jgi:O-antigen/teichoic acid export membrane protein